MISFDHPLFATFFLAQYANTENIEAYQRSRVLSFKVFPVQIFAALTLPKQSNMICELQMRVAIQRISIEEDKRSKCSKSRHVLWLSIFVCHSCHSGLFDLMYAKSK